MATAPVHSHPTKLEAGGLPPGRRGLPLLGETLSFMRDSATFYSDRRAEFGPIFSTHVLGKPMVMVAGADLCQRVMTSGMKELTWGDGWPMTFQELLGRSLFLQDGAEHKKKRRLLAAAFNAKALAGYVPHMERLTRAHLRRWEQAREFKWMPKMKALTFEIASELLLGVETAEQLDALARDFNRLTAGFFALPLRIPGMTYQRSIRARDRLLQSLEAAIIRKRARAERGTDALARLIEGTDDEGNRLTLEEIKVQALLLQFAGHDTSTSFLTSLVRALFEHRDVWDRARAEQLELEIDGPLTMEHLGRMPYLDRVLKEVERLYPPVLGGFRGVVEPFEIAGYVIPPGHKLSYRIYDTNTDPELFDEPLRFDPDRFGPARAEHKRHRFGIVTFGGGPRVCLGMAFALIELKIVASHLLRDYAWEPRPGQDLSMRYMPFLHPKSHYEVRFWRRGEGG